MRPLTIPRGRWFTLALPALLAALAYLPALGFGYVWDDFYYVVERESLHDWSAAWAAAFSPYLGTAYYLRPLPILSLALGGAAAAHTINLLLHIANSALVAALCAGESGSQRRAAALLAGCLYALHPALIQTVAWVSCRFDLLLTSFSLLFLLTLRRPPSWARTLLLAVSFLFAALSKESAVALVPLYFLWRHCASAAVFGTSRRDDAALLLAGLAYLALRAHCLGGVEASIPGALDASQHLLLALKTLGFYVGLVVAPFFRLAPLHQIQWPLSLSDGQIVLGIATLPALAACLWRARRSTPLLVMLLSGIVALLPVANLARLGIGDSFASDRLLTLPLAFFCSAAALALLQRAPRVRVAVLPLWFALALLTLGQTLPSWKDNMALWTWAVQRAPHSLMAQNNYMAALNEQRRFEETTAFMRKLETQGTPSSIQRIAASRAYAALGMRNDAMVQLDQIARDYGKEMSAADLAPLCAEQAWLHMEQGQLDAASALLQAALAKGETDPESRYHLGAVLTALDRPEGPAQIGQALQQAGPARAVRWREGIDALISGLRALAAQAQPAPPPGALAQACLH